MDGLALHHTIHGPEHGLVVPANMPLEVAEGALQHDEELPDDFEQMGWWQTFERSPIAEGGLVHKELSSFVHTNEVLPSTHPQDVDVVTFMTDPTADDCRDELRQLQGELGYRSRPASPSERNPCSVR